MKTVYAKQLMEKWNMDDLNFVDFVTAHVPRLYGDTKDYLLPYDKRTMRPIDFPVLEYPPGRADFVRDIEQVFFYVHEVERFEKAYPELFELPAHAPIADTNQQQKSYAPSEGERPIRGYAAIGKRMGVKSETVSKVWRQRGAPIERVGHRVEAYESCLREWAKDWGKRRMKKTPK